MKNIRSSFVIILTIALLALTAFSVMAADGDGDILPCAEGEVSGTVVAVDGNTVTIHTGDGVYCTVTSMAPTTTPSYPCWVCTSAILAPNPF